MATIAADDPGADTLTYAITGGTGATAFAVDAATGEITVADSAQLDFETTPSLTLDVRVSDEDGGVDTTTVDDQPAQPGVDHRHDLRRHERERPLRGRRNGDQRRHPRTTRRHGSGGRDRSDKRRRLLLVRGSRFRHVPDSRSTADRRERRCRVVGQSGGDDCLPTT